MEIHSDEPPIEMECDDEMIEEEIKVDQDTPVGVSIDMVDTSQANNLNGCGLDQNMVFEIPEELMK